MRRTDSGYLALALLVHNICTRLSHPYGNEKVSEALRQTAVASLKFAH